MKKTLIFISLILGNLPVFAQFNDSAFTYTFGGIQNDGCNQIKPTADGGYIMIGTTNSSGCGNTDMYVIKTDSLCRHQWTRTYGGELNEAGYSVEQTFDHGYVFLGYTNSFGAGGYDVYMVKTDSAGVFQWQRTYGGQDWDFGYSIKQLADSGFVIVGQTYSYGKGNGDVYVIRTDKLGDTLWTRTVGDTGYECGNSVTVFRDSLYYIAGATTSYGNGDTNMYFVEMNDKGILKLAKTLTGATTKNNVAYSIRNTLNNNFILYGYIDSIPGSSATTTHSNEIWLEADTTGKTVWIQYFYSSSFTAIGKDAIELPDGYYLTTGTMFLFGNYAMHIQYLGPGGWWQDGLAFEGTQNEQGNSIAYHNKHSFAFAGTTTFGAGDMDAYVVRFTYDSLVVTYKLSQNNYKDTSVCYLGIPSASVIPPGVKLFPNPVSASATVLVQGDIGEHYFLSIYNESGQMVLTTALSVASHGQSIGHFEKSNLSAGTYMYGVANKEGERVAAGKFIIE